jgi:hypothetical protein
MQQANTLKSINDVCITTHEESLWIALDIKSNTWYTPIIETVATFRAKYKALARQR